MTFAIFSAHRDTPLDAEAWQREAVVPPGAAQGWEARARDYIPEPNAIEAVNVAIALGKPLLVTGEPGVGKSELAAAIAWQLSLGKPFKFVAKSTSEARDLFYRYDALGRFHAIEEVRHLTARAAAGDRDAPALDAARLSRADDARNFIEYAALGRAILTAHEPDDIAGLIARSDASPATGDPRERRIYAHPGQPQRSVVLIDEIDKASADFCNDLLDEIDTMQFSVPEVTDRPTPQLDRRLRPIVVITSNRERDLPPPFLRRCVYHDIPVPRSVRELDPEAREAVGPHDYFVENILSARVGELAARSALMASVLGIVEAMRRDVRLSRTPGTAELIDALQALVAAGAALARPLQAQPALVELALRVLVKGPEDLAQARRMAELRELPAEGDGADLPSGPGGA